MMKCVFFVSEEIGCQGSSCANLSFFDDCRYVVQCDRKGNSDIVTRYCGYALCSEEFLHDAAPEKFGYSQSEGLITDVITLKTSGLNISCINLSCGYYLPHTPHEFTQVEDLMNCYRFVRHIIENCNKTYPHQIVRQHADEYRHYNPHWYWDNDEFTSCALGSHSWYDRINEYCKRHFQAVSVKASPKSQKSRNNKTTSPLTNKNRQS
jgi:hypothetical protein